MSTETKDTTFLFKPEDEAKLIEVLKSDASRKEKSDACRELSRFSSPDSIAVLSELMADAEMAHMARYALETMQNAAADEALRKALGDLDGVLLVGVIGSVGVRRDTVATEALAKHLGHSDAQVKSAAARALGNVGTVFAAKSLEAALEGADAAQKKNLYEGLLRCAENLAAGGWTEYALEVYDKVRGMDAPHEVKTAALRGAVVLRGEKGLPLIVEALHGDDYTQAMAAARAAQEIPGAEVSEVLAGELASLPADRRELVSMVLVNRSRS
jgi:HEAT repeat protein